MKILLICALALVGLFAAIWGGIGITFIAKSSFMDGTFTIFLIGLCWLISVLCGILIYRVIQKIIKGEVLFR